MSSTWTLKPGVDIVYVATPPDSHRELALKVLAAGKPVYVEKPMAMNHAECLDMIAAAKRFIYFENQYFTCGKIAAATEVGSPGEFASRYVMSAEDEAALAGAGACASAADDGCAAHGESNAVGSGTAQTAAPSESDSPWTRYLLTAALANSDTRRVLWYMPWRNDPGAAGTGAYGTPVEGSRYAADFRRFTKHPFIRMANTLPPLY